MTARGRPPDKGGGTKRRGGSVQKAKTPRSTRVRGGRDPLIRGSKVQPIRWRRDRLELLDQRALPDKTVYVTCRTAEQVAKAIRDMVVRGAPAIGCAAAYGVVLGKGAKAAYEVLAKSRPTAVNLFWALERMRGAKELEAEANAIYAEDIAANRTLGEFGAELIPDRARI